MAIFEFFDHASIVFHFFYINLQVYFVKPWTILLPIEF